MEERKREEGHALRIRTGPRTARRIQSYCDFTGYPPGTLLRRALTRFDYRDVLSVEYTDLFRVSESLGRLDGLLADLLISGADLSFALFEELSALAKQKEEIVLLAGNLIITVLEKREEMSDDCALVMREAGRHKPFVPGDVERESGGGAFTVTLSQKDHEALTERAAREGKTKKELILLSLGRLFRFGCFVIAQDELFFLCPELDRILEAVSSLLARLEKDRSVPPLPKDFALLKSLLDELTLLLSEALEKAGREGMGRRALREAILSSGPDQITRLG